MYQIVHAICFIACVMRENFGVNTDILSQAMRTVEVVSLTLYLGTILLSLEVLSWILIRENTLNPDERINSKDPKDFLSGKCPQVDSRMMSGTVVYWLIIEVLVYTFYLTSLMIFMVKSRFMNMVKDPSLEFENIKMSFMVQRIIKQVDLDIE